MRSFSIGLLAFVLAATPALAQDGGDEDGAFDEALKNYGYAGGAAWQCAPETGKDAVIADAMRVYNGVARLFGTDRAFFFSAAFGAGTVDDIDTASCERFSADFAAGLERGTKAEGQ
jgi:hypothetical protein